MSENHFPGHQQALLKDDAVVVVLSFPEHLNFEETFDKFDYDSVLDLCELQIDATLGSIWNGTNFQTKPYESWINDGNGSWVPPVEKPTDGEYDWDEKAQAWKKFPEASTDLPMVDEDGKSISDL